MGTSPIFLYVGVCRLSPERLSWFSAEIFSAVNQVDKPECNPSVVCRIINDAYPTDYYITNKKFDWLITENHHDIVQFIGKGLDVDKIKTVCTK